MSDFISDQDQVIQPDFSVARLDQLGLVAGAMDDLNFITLIDRLLGGKKEKQRVSMGQRGGAMVLHLMSFVNRTLYQTPEFLAAHAFEPLLGENAAPDAFNDDALGRFLDAVYQYGPSKFFQSMAMSMLTNKQLAGKSLRLDSTAMCLEGAYSASQEGEPDEGIRITFGYSKDGRPDLKQVMLALVTTGPANLPVLANPLNGNTSDKTEFRKIISEFQSNFVGPTGPLWIADSALYSKQWLMDQTESGQGFYPWLTKVPETFKKATEIIEKPASHFEWEYLSNGYQATEMKTIYGGIKQSWTLYFSQQAFERETKTLNNKIEKEAKKFEKLLKSLSNREFKCEQDAQKSLTNILKKARWHILFESEITTKKCYAKQGRPKKEGEFTTTYKITGIITINKNLFLRAQNKRGRFILATNLTGHNLQKALLSSPTEEDSFGNETITDTGRKPAIATPKQQSRAEEILKAYKELRGTEESFKLLKDKTFMMNRFFLHKESRIEALIVVFALAIFIYNYLEYVTVLGLKTANVTLKGPAGAKLKTNTLRRVFEIFRAVSALRHPEKLAMYTVERLKPAQLEILKAIGPPYRKRYGLC